MSLIGRELYNRLCLLQLCTNFFFPLWFLQMPNPAWQTGDVALCLFFKKSHISIIIPCFKCQGSWWFNCAFSLMISISSKMWLSSEGHRTEIYFEVLCHRLKCLCPSFICWDPSHFPDSQNHGFRTWESGKLLGHEWGALMNGSSALEEETGVLAVPLPSTTWGYSEWTDGCQPEGRSSLDASSTGNFALDFPAFRTVRYKYCCLKYPVYDNFYSSIPKWWKTCILAK